jgi:hypothetical protein
VRQGPEETYKGGQSSPWEGSSSGGSLDSRWGGNGASSRSGQEARGREGGLSCTRGGTRTGERAKGGTASGSNFYLCGGRQGKERGLRGGDCVEERDGRRGGASDAVDGQHRPMVDNRGRVAHTRSVVPSRGGRAVMSGPHLQFQAAVNLLQNHIQTDSNYSNFDCLKNGLPEFKKFE